MDPQLVDPAAGDCRLQPTSPVIDRCVIETATVDIDGEARPHAVRTPATPHDMGADQHGSVPVLLFVDEFDSGTTGSWTAVCP